MILPLSHILLFDFFLFVSCHAAFLSGLMTAVPFIVCRTDNKTLEHYNQKLLFKALN